MNSLHALRERIRPIAFVVMVAIIVAATYFEFVYSGPPSVFSIMLWIVAVPFLLSATVKGAQNYPMYQLLASTGFIAIGILQYLDGDWHLLAGLFVLAGIAGLISEMRNRTNPSPS